MNRSGTSHLVAWATDSLPDATGEAQGGGTRVRGLASYQNRTPGFLTRPTTLPTPNSSLDRASTSRDLSSGGMDAVRAPKPGVDIAEGRMPEDTLP